MDNNNKTDTDVKHLTMPARLLLCTGNFLLLCAYATDAAPAFGLLMLLISAVLSCVLLIEANRILPLVAAVFAVNISPFVISVIFSGSFITALNILLPLAFAVPIWISVINKGNRFTAIAISTVSASALMIIIFALSVQKQFGVLTADNVKLAIDALVEPVGNMFREMSTQSAGGMSVQLISDADIANMLYIVKSTLFGSLAVIMMIAAYLTTLFTRLILKAVKMTDLLPSSVRAVLRAHMKETGPEVELLRETVCWRIEVDSISAWIYVISYILTAVFASDNTLLFYVVSGNISTILSPIFIYCGVREIALGFKGRSQVNAGSKFILIMCIVFIIVNPSLVTTLLSLLGVTSTLRENKVRRNVNSTRKER